MSKLLITGATGYIGSHTVVVLSQLGHEVVMYDNLSGSTHAVIGKLAQITHKPNMPFIKGDVRDTQKLRETIATYGVEAVVHFAGLKSVGESALRPIDYYENNVMGTISLLNAMAEQKVKKLVFSSSATVYGYPQYLPLDESHPICAANPYGRTKLHVEEMLLDIASSDPEWGIVCLRYFNPVGAHDSGIIGENPNGIPNNLMPYIAQVAAGIRSELFVFGHDYPTTDGTGVRDYIHIMDLAEGHAAALDYLTQATGWQAVNLGTGKGYSVLDMVRAFELVSERNVPYHLTSRRSGDVAICYANTRKASDLLKWNARRTLEEMCSSTWQFQMLIE